MDRTEITALLRHNTGFDDTGLWVEYAVRNDFQPVLSTRVTRCPDCSGPATRRPWGQFVYYSTLLRLLECQRCALIWADARLDPSVTEGHFETAYKDVPYFQDARRRVFEHIARLVDRVAPAGARVLDVGGARGHLMAAVRRLRPDTQVVVHDISERATALAAAQFGFDTITGDARSLAVHDERYEVVVLSDVLYYEPNIAMLWTALSRLVKPGGSVLIRLPNKAALIRLAGGWIRWTRGSTARALQDRVPFHNPEHIYVCRRRYLRARLDRSGFTASRFLPTPLLDAGRWSVAGPPWFQMASIANRALPGRPVLTPSMLVTASRRVDG